jgi:hypothetical protein
MAAEFGRRGGPPKMFMGFACALRRLAACLNWLTGTRPGGARANPSPRGRHATPTSSAGHAPAGAKANRKLTFNSDHQAKVGQQCRTFIALSRPFPGDFSEAGKG